MSAPAQVAIVSPRTSRTVVVATLLSPHADVYSATRGTCQWRPLDHWRHYTQCETYLRTHHEGARQETYASDPEDLAAGVSLYLQPLNSNTYNEQKWKNSSNHQNLKDLQP